MQAEHSPPWQYLPSICGLQLRMPMAVTAIPPRNGQQRGGLGKLEQLEASIFARRWNGRDELDLLPVFDKFIRKSIMGERLEIVRREKTKRSASEHCIGKQIEIQQYNRPACRMKNSMSRKRKNVNAVTTATEIVSFRHVNRGST